MATKSTLCLFYIDNTLTEPRVPAPTPQPAVPGQPTPPIVKPEMPVVAPHVISALAELKNKVSTGIVTGSDLETLSRQFGGKVLDKFDYVFVDNGLTAYKGEVLLPSSTSLKAYLGLDNCTTLAKKILEEIIKLPVQMTGTFLELRTDLVHITPIGRNADAEERKLFQRSDNRKGHRQKLIDALQPTLASPAFASKKLKLSLSGTISVNIVPETWDKSYCIHKHLANEPVTEIYIIGDKTRPGGEGSALPPVSGNLKKITGYTVLDPTDTLELLQDPTEPFKVSAAACAPSTSQSGQPIASVTSNSVPVPPPQKPSPQRTSPQKPSQQQG